MLNFVPVKFTLFWIHAAVISCVLMLSGCGEEPESDISETEPKPTDSVEQRPAMPTIYIDQIIIPVSAENRRELYKDLLSICKEEHVSIKELTPKEFNRLGTIRLQRWMDESRTAYRLEAWDYQLAEPQQQPHCHFELISIGRHVLIEEAGLRGIRLDDNQPYEMTPLSNIDASLLLRSPARKDTSPTDQIGEVAGQPCVETTINGTVICTWSAGVAWGFEPVSEGIESVSAVHQYVLFRAIILQQDPAENVVDRITTTTFKVGEPLDETAMQPAPATALPAQKASR